VAQAKHGDTKRGTLLGCAWKLYCWRALYLSSGLETGFKVGIKTVEEASQSTGRFI